MGGQAAKLATREELDESIRTYGRVFDHLREGCQIISRDFRYLYVNGVVVLQGRTTRDKLIGNTMESCYPGIEKTEMFANLKRCVFEKEPCAMENEFTFPDGSMGWFDLRMEPLPEGAIILSIDITERKEAEQRAALIDELKGTFVRIVSQQLSTPISTMRGNLDRLRQNGNSDPQVLEAHSAAVEVIDRLGEMVSAVEPRNKPHEDDTAREPVSFEELWQPLYAECKRRCQNAHVQLVYNAPKAPLPSIVCNPDNIKLVLLGLTDNALRYTTSGKITIELSQPSDSIRFQITDTGTGLPPSEQTHIFTRFFRGNNAVRANPNGTGLSLAVAKYHIERHGGRIGFSSEQGKGSTFWFEVPVGK